MYRTINLRIVLLLSFFILPPNVVNAFFDTNFPQNTHVTVFNNTEQKMLISFLADGCTDISIAITKSESIEQNTPHHPAHLWYSHPMAENPYRHCKVDIIQPSQQVSYQYKGVGYLMETDRSIVAYALKEKTHKRLRNTTFQNYVYFDKSKHILPISTHRSRDTFLSIIQTDPSNKRNTELLQISP